LRDFRRHLPCPRTEPALGWAHQGFQCAAAECDAAPGTIDSLTDNPDKEDRKLRPETICGTSAAWHEAPPDARAIFGRVNEDWKTHTLDP
jgi:hypothetical protein